MADSRRHPGAGPGDATGLIAVAGAAPGLGKSTVSAALRDWLAGRGLGVELFAEQDVLTRCEFARVAAEFRAGGVVDLKTVLAAVSDYVASIQQAAVDVAITDSLVPFVPSLLAWGHDELAASAFLHELAMLLMPVRPVIVYLDGDPRTALARAASREGPGWLDWFVRKLARYQVQPAVRDLETACAYLEAERDVTLRLIPAQQWEVVVIDHADEHSAAEVARRTEDALAPWLAGGSWLPRPGRDPVR